MNETTRPTTNQNSHRPRGWNFTPEHQRKARAAVRPESNRANGARGFAATAARYGRDFAIRASAQWRRESPNRLEQLVMHWLNEFQVAFEREAQIGRFYVDFLCRDFHLAIEVDGRTWHTNHALHGQDRAGRDRRKDDALRAQGYCVLRLSEAAIRDGSAKDALDLALHTPRRLT